MVDDEIGNLVEEQGKLEAAYDEIMTDRSANHQTAGTVSKQANRTRAQNAAQNITNSTNVMARNLRQNPLTTDNLTKIQGERYELIRRMLHNFLQGCLHDI